MNHGVNYLDLFEVNYEMFNNNIEAYRNKKIRVFGGKSQIIDTLNEIGYHNVLYDYLSSGKFRCAYKIKGVS